MAASFLRWVSRSISLRSGCVDVLPRDAVVSGCEQRRRGREAARGRIRVGRLRR